MVAQNIQDRIKLNNGIMMPQFGLGVWRAQNGREAKQAVLWALQAGYRLIDTAALYQNEESVGEAIIESGIPRNEIFVTTKLWNEDQGYEQTFRALKSSLKRLKLDYVDLYLEHYPVPELYKDSWRAMEQLQQDGLVCAIGVSNFNPHHIDSILQSGTICPAVNQLELHPWLARKEMIAYCKKHGIAVEAWASIFRGKVDESIMLQDLSKKYKKTPAQIALRWALQQGIIVIPKSSKQERIMSNSEIFDFDLVREDMELIDLLNNGERIGKDPDAMDFATEFSSINIGKSV